MMCSTDCEMTIILVEGDEVHGHVERKLEVSSSFRRFSLLVMISCRLDKNLGSKVQQEYLHENKTSNGENSQIKARNRISNALNRDEDMVFFAARIWCLRNLLVGQETSINPTATHSRRQAPPGHVQG